MSAHYNSSGRPSVDANFLAETALPPEIAAVAARGFRLFPVQSRGKRPLINAWPRMAADNLHQLGVWAAAHPGCNWGAATGQTSGVIVIDVDGPKGRASLADLERRGFALPHTLTVTTGRQDGGAHLYYRVPRETKIPNDNSGKIAPGIDVRGDGGYVVVPPSVHETGAQYRWHDTDTDIADLPAWVIDRLSDHKSSVPFVEEVGSQLLTQGGRTNQLVSFAGSMLRRGMSPAAIEAALLTENAARCSPPLRESKVRAIARDIPHRYPAGEGAWKTRPGDDWLAPEPLGTALPAVPAFDPELLPASLRPMVEDVAMRMQVPVDFPAVIAVASLAGLCGRRVLIQPKEHDSSWTVVPNLWGGIVGAPGIMKSPTIACITAPVRAIESQWRAEYATELSEAKTTKLLAELNSRAWQQQYIAATKKRGGEPPMRPDDSVPEPRQMRTIVIDATFESLHQIMADNHAGVFVLRDELTGWLASLERQGRESERAFYLECWAGDTGFTIDRIQRGSVYVEHCCVSLFGGIQPARLRAYLADALKDGPSNDGLIQRFQLLVWPDTPKEWHYQDRRPDAAAQRGAEEVFKRIARMDTDSPVRLKFAPDAQALFVEWLTDLEGRLRADDVSTFMQAHLAKYRSLMPSLALLFALADGSLESVGLHHSQQAADWCEYLAHHARRIYASRISPERLAAISLVQKLQKGWKRESGSFSLRDVYSNDWSGLSTPEEVRAALKVLKGAGWVRAEDSKPETGRPSEKYTINPKIGGTHVDD